MILAQIKKYLTDHRQASLSELAIHFDIDPDAMRGMLARWVHKGRVSKVDLGANCQKGCASCSCGATLEIYTWQG